MLSVCGTVQQKSGCLGNKFARQPGSTKIFSIQHGGNHQQADSRNKNGHGQPRIGDVDGSDFLRSENKGKIVVAHGSNKSFDDDLKARSGIDGFMHEKGQKTWKGNAVGSMKSKQTA